jgi:predicted DNA-binding transcriptional regulator AlpA
VTGHLVGVSEIAKMLGVTRQRAVQLVGDYGDFPAPTAVLASGRIWEREAVETWIGNHADRRPGRPKRQPGETREAGEP